MAKNNSLGCYEVLAHVDDAVRSTMPEHMNYFVLGGVAGSAYESADTKFSMEDHVVWASDAADKPVIREAGSRRDIDILIDGILTKKQGKQLKADVTLAVGGALKASVFGIGEHEVELSRTDRVVRSVGTFVSQRYVDSDGQRYFGMHPVEVPVKAESYEPWMFVTPQGYNVDVLHPVAHLLAYDVRSIGGPRPKDAKKIEESWKNINRTFDVEALVAEEGDLHEWKLFADSMQSVRDGTMRINDPAMQGNSGLDDLAAFRAKSRFMGFVESNQKIVDAALHGPAQKVLNIFTGAN